MNATGRKRRAVKGPDGDGAAASKRAVRQQQPVVAFGSKDAEGHVDKCDVITFQTESGLHIKSLVASYENKKVGIVKMVETLLLPYAGKKDDELPDKFKALAVRSFFIASIAFVVLHLLFMLGDMANPISLSHIGLNQIMELCKGCG